MKKWFLLLALLPSLARAGGPKYTYPGVPGLDDEMQNIYHNISYPTINNGTCSSCTITNLSTSAGSVLNSCGYVKGSVVQKVKTTNLATTVTTSTSFVTTLSTASITPLCSSDQIRITAIGTLAALSAGHLAYAVLHGGNISEVTGNGFVQDANASSAAIVPTTLFIIDSPNTTSATLYAVYVKSDSNSVSIQWNIYVGTTIMVLEEIAS